MRALFQKLFKRRPAMRFLECPPEVAQTLVDFLNFADGAPAKMKLFVNDLANSTLSNDFEGVIQIESMGNDVAQRLGGDGLLSTRLSPFAISDILLRGMFVADFVDHKGFRQAYELGCQFAENIDSRFSDRPLLVPAFMDDNLLDTCEAPYEAVRGPNGVLSQAIEKKREWIEGHSNDGELGSVNLRADGIRNELDRLIRSYKGNILRLEPIYQAFDPKKIKGPLIQLTVACEGAAAAAHVCLHRPGNNCLINISRSALEAAMAIEGGVKPSESDVQVQQVKKTLEAIVND